MHNYFFSLSRLAHRVESVFVTDVCVCVLSVLILSGVPDSPRNCSLLYLNSSTSSMECYPGYAGGEAPSFSVYKSAPGTATELLETSITWTDGVAMLVSQGLEPNTNYTLRVYGENGHGASNEAFGIYVRTPGTEALCVIYLIGLRALRLGV